MKRKGEREGMDMCTIHVKVRKSVEHFKKGMEKSYCHFVSTHEAYFHTYSYDIYTGINIAWSMNMHVFKRDLEPSIFSLAFSLLQLVLDSNSSLYLKAHHLLLHLLFRSALYFLFPVHEFVTSHGKREKWHS